MKNLVDQIYEADLKLDSVVWLSGSFHGFTDDSFFEDVILEADAPYMHKSMSVFSDLPDWADDEEGFSQWLYAKPKIRGFIVKAITPKPTRFYPDGGYSSIGFGLSTSTYFYVDRVEDAVALAKQWQEEMLEKWRCASAPSPRRTQSDARQDNRHR